MKKITLFIIFVFLGCSGDEQNEELDLREEENFSAELFFSEYIEGSSFNKALEIVNLTGENIDLEAENYSIKKQQNGGGDWMSEFQLSGNLAHNNVHVISNESADIPELLEEANQLKTGAPMDFNGNDPIGLFKEGELIDVIGELNNPEDFALDKTLRRKSTITEPTTEFHTEEWETFETNTANGLGDY